MEDQSQKQDLPPADASIVRRLGRIESYQIALQKLDQLRGIILACRYTLPEGLVPHNLQHELIGTFERAVARVVLEHPLMHVGLAGEDTNKPSWVRLESIDLQNHIEWRTVRAGGADEFQKSLLDTSYEQVDTKFTHYQTTPGWKIKVIRQEGANFIEVLLVFNHTNLDGSSAKTFHKDLLQSLHGQPTAEDKIPLKDHVLTLPETSTTLSPPPENLVEFPVDSSAMSGFVKVEVETPTPNYPRRPEQAHWAPIKTTPFKTQFRSITVPKSRLSKLLQACHNHETTLTGFLHAITLVSLASLLEPSNASAFGFLTAMDIRRFLPSNHPVYPWFKPDRAMSNYVTIVSHIADEELVAAIRSKHSSPQAREDLRLRALTDLMWSAARKARRDVETKLDQGTKNDMIGFSGAIDDWRAQLTKHTQRPRPSSWCITNLGVMDGSPTISSPSSPTDARAQPEPGSTWSLTRSQLLMSANVASSAFGISMAAVKGGDLVVTCSWQDCVVDVNLGEALVRGLEAWVNFTAAQYKENGWLPAPAAEKFEESHRPSRPSDRARFGSQSNLDAGETSQDSWPYASFLRSSSLLKKLALSVFNPLLVFLRRLVQLPEESIQHEPV